MKNFLSPKISLILLLSVLAGIVLFKTIRYSSLQARATLKEQLKEEIRKELSQEFAQEIPQLVKKEVDAYWAEQKVAALMGANQPAEISAHPTAPTIPLHQTTETPQITRVNSPSEENPSETKDEAIERIVRNIIRQEMRELTEKELSEMVAANFEEQIQIAGITKTPHHEYQLAQAVNEKNENSTKTNDNKATQGEMGEVRAGEKKAESLERALIQRGGILLPKGKLQVEPSITYAHFSSNRITIQGFNILPVLVIGSISTETVKRDVFINTWAFKYGLFKNFQTEVKVPMRWEHDRVTDTFGSESTREYGGLGDIEFGMSRQIGWEHGFIPDLLANISVKTNSGEAPYNRDIGLGTGHWAVRYGLTAVKSSDPAVVFGGLNYTWNIKRNINDFGEVDPGDTIGYTLGTAIALSYQTAINFSFDHSVTTKLMKDKRNVPGSFINAANLKTGFTWAINERSSVDFGVAVGITNDAPDMTIDIRFPYTF